MFHFAPKSNKDRANQEAGQNTQPAPLKVNSTNRGNGKPTSVQAKNTKPASQKDNIPSSKNIIIKDEIRKDNSEIKKLQTSVSQLSAKVAKLEKTEKECMHFLTEESVLAAYSVTNPMNDHARQLPASGNPSEALGREEELAALDDLPIATNSGNQRIIFDPTGVEQVFYSSPIGLYPIGLNEIAVMTYAIGNTQTGKGVAAVPFDNEIRYFEQDGANDQFHVYTDAIVTTGVPQNLIPNAESVRVNTTSVPRHVGAHMVFMLGGVALQFTDTLGNVTPFLPIGNHAGSAFYDTSVPAADSATAGFDLYFTAAGGSAFDSFLVFYAVANPSNILKVTLGNVNGAAAPHQLVLITSLFYFLYRTTSFSVVTQARQSLESSKFRVNAFQVVAQCTASSFANGGSMVTKVTQQSINPPDGITNQGFVSYGNMLKARFELGSDAIYVPSNIIEWRDLVSDPLNNPWTGPNCNQPYYKFTTIMHIISTGSSGVIPPTLSMQFFGACFIECSVDNTILKQTYPSADPNWEIVRQAMLKNIHLHHNPDHEKSRMQWFHDTMTEVLAFGKSVVTSPVTRELASGAIELLPLFLEML